MSKQMFEKLLSDFKRSNSERKKKIASNYGYTNPADYQAYLEKEIGQSQYTAKAEGLPKGPRPVIHVVDILDASSSMIGGKIEGALEGINIGIKNLTSSDANIDYTYSLVRFSDYGKEEVVHLKVDPRLIPRVNILASGMTALFDAIGMTIYEVKAGLNKEDKVLINVYTDGEENNSRKYNKQQINELIKSLEGQFTVTFIGTERDTNYVINNLGIDKSNTLSYDGTAKGLADSVGQTMSMRAEYSNKVLKGEDVSRGFYKDIKE